MARLTDLIAETMDPQLGAVMKSSRVLNAHSLYESNVVENY